VPLLEDCSVPQQNQRPGSAASAYKTSIILQEEVERIILHRLSSCESLRKIEKADLMSAFFLWPIVQIYVL